MQASVGAQWEMMWSLTRESCPDQHARLQLSSLYQSFHIICEQHPRLKMPVVHIVLVKVKQAVLSNGFDELKAKCETLKDLPIAASKAKEIKWGPPAYPGRNEGYNWGEYPNCSRTLPGCSLHVSAHLRKM